METLFLLLLFSTIFVSGVLHSSSAEPSPNRSTSSSSRIIGGQDAERHQFPYQVALKTKLGHYFCGGTLISKDFVLTSMYCSYAEVIMAHMGLSNLDQNGTDVEVRRVTKIVLHPKVTRRTLYYYNVALLQLESPVSFTNAIQPAQLASGKECEALGEATVSGWGVVEGDVGTEPLKFVTLPVLDSLECDDRISRYSDRYAHSYIELCLGASGTQYQGSAVGDYGSPVYRESTKKLIGLTGYACGYRYLMGMPDFPTIFINVCILRKWIVEEANL